MEGANGDGARRGLVTIVESIDPRPYMFQSAVYGRLIYTVIYMSDRLSTQAKSDLHLPPPPELRSGSKEQQDVPHHQVGEGGELGKWGGGIRGVAPCPTSGSEEVGRVTRYGGSISRMTLNSVILSVWRMTVKF